MYKTNALKVKEFMAVFGQEVKEEPKFPDDNTVNARIDLIHEEFDELKQAVYSNNGTLVAIADALTDILYVTYGMAHSFGIDIDECFREVHKSNMSKLGKDGKPIFNEINDSYVFSTINDIGFFSRFKHGLYLIIYLFCLFPTFYHFSPFVISVLVIILIVIAT